MQEIAMRNRPRISLQNLNARIGSYYRARYYDPTAGRFTSEDPTSFGGGINFYAYTRNNPIGLADPSGFFGVGNIWPALKHYCDGSSTPWSAPFGSINWGNTDALIESKIRALAGFWCEEKTIPMDVTIGAQTWGADAAIIGRHTVRVQGTIQLHCDCTYEFHGDMSSALGYDLYDFPPSNRDPIAEASTWVGRNSCPSTGRPFWIYLPGSRNVSHGGRTKGASTCPCKH